MSKNKGNDKQEKVKEKVGQCLDAVVKMAQVTDHTFWEGVKSNPDSYKETADAMRKCLGLDSDNDG